MNGHFWERPLFDLAGHHITLLGVVAFVALLAAGMIVASVAHSGPVAGGSSAASNSTKSSSRLSRHCSASPRSSSSSSARSTAWAVPFAWNAPLPGISISLLQIFLLVALLISVFWLSSRTKRFLFNRFLVRAGSIVRSIRHLADCSNPVLVIGVFIVLQNTGIHLEALTVFAGAVGVGVGFGLQNITSNFISGLVILAERPITIGDRVEVEGVAGQVQQIRARSTVIVTNDNITMIVPNPKFIDSPVTNWTYGDPRVRFRFPVGVAYGSDVEKNRS